MCWEDWECGECGARIRRDKAPRICPVCGIAGGSYVQAEPHLELDEDSGHFRREWFAAGFRHPSAVAAVDRQLPR